MLGVYLMRLYEVCRLGYIGYGLMARSLDHVNMDLGWIAWIE